MTELKTRANSCELGDLKDRMIMTQIVCGLADNFLREKLLRETDLTLDKCITMCKAAEIVQAQASELNLDKPVKVHAVKTHKVSPGKPAVKPKPFQKGRSPKRRTAPRNPSTKPQQKCPRCGYNHLPDRYCPAIGKTCAKCQGRDHFAQQCQTRKVNLVDTDPSPDDFVINSVTMVNAVECDSDWVEPLIINGQVLPVKLDSCAQTNVMSHEDWKTLTPRPQIYPTDIKLQAYPNFRIPVMGKCVTKVQLRGKQYNVQFIIVPDKAPTLLGKNACVRMGLVKRINSVKSEQPSSVCENILDEYSDLFEGLGCLPGVVHIKLKPDAEPVVETCRRVPFKLLEPLKEELARMVKAGIIEPIEEPTEWVHPLHIVPKPNGQLHICLDPRNLNRSIQREHFVLPTREEITEHFCQLPVFHKVRCYQGILANEVRRRELSTLYLHHSGGKIQVPSSSFWYQ